MLLDSVQSLGKQVEDVYSMFARWDNEGSGTVTATQFLRVLARLHVHLSDDDQDFLIELLDANAQGRVNFESLLSFCFCHTYTVSLGSSFDNQNYLDHSFDTSALSAKCYATYWVSIFDKFHKMPPHDRPLCTADLHQNKTLKISDAYRTQAKFKKIKKIKI